MRNITAPHTTKHIFAKKLKCSKLDLVDDN